jgi:uncharacterized protein
MNRYDVLIIGAGPAGIFAALELSQKSKLRVLVLEKGADIDKRRCPIYGTDKKCAHCEFCDRISGWGGAGAFSDGKLTLSAQVGGQLGDLLGQDATTQLLKYVDDTYVNFGAPTRVYGQAGDEVEALTRRAVMAGLRLLYFPVRHMGTDGSTAVLRAMRDELLRRGVEIRCDVEIAEILAKDSVITGVRTAKGEVIEGRYVMVAPGREGNEWLSKAASALGLHLAINPVDIGVRVEMPAEVLEPLTNIVYEPKLYYYSKSFDDQIRTFCACPYGEVISEWAGDVMTVNGHSYVNKKTHNTNFAILVQKNFTEPFRDPVAYGKYIARLANLLSGGVMVQRLGDLQSGRRTNAQRLERCIVTPTLKEATPGDLGLVLPYRYLVNILEMLEALDKLAPGVASRHTLLYGVEVKFYSSRLELDTGLETNVRNLFAAGDGAGVTRGLVQASASGVVVARAILARG